MEIEKIKIMGLSFANKLGSPMAWIVQDALAAIEEFGEKVSSVAEFETEFVDLADKEIRLCLNCNDRYCIPPGCRSWKEAERPAFECIQQKDYVAKELFPRLVEVDGFVLGCPTHNLSVTSKWRLFWDRTAAGMWKGWFTSKPATAIVSGYGPFGGQETCLCDITAGISIAELVDVSRMPACVNIGELPSGLSQMSSKAQRDKIRKSITGYSSVLLNAQRVAEFAIIRKVAIRQLGDIYDREFIHIFHAPHGGAAWEWRRLDKEDEDYLMNL